MPRFYFNDPAAPAANASLTVGSVALIEVDGCLLLDQRRDTGTWGLIGGAIEPNETVEQTVRREVLEETGLTVIGVDFFGTFSDPSRLIEYADGKIRRVITFAYRASVGPATALRISDESLQLAYVPLDELAGIEIVATHRQIVEAYLAGRPRFLSPVLF